MNDDRATRGRVGLALLALLWVLTLCGAPLLGSHAITWEQLAGGDPTATVILWQLRLPRVLVALMAGGALALAGLSFQTLFRNPLAEPYTLGIASGAALGAMLAVQLELSTGRLGLPAVGLASFAGALAVTALILTLAASGRTLETGTLLLAGIAVSLSCSALMLFLQYLADFTKTFSMVRWMMGGVAVVGYAEVAWLAPWTAFGIAAIAWHRWELNLLLAGEELAVSRGVGMGRLRLVVLLVTSAMIGAVVAVTGPVGFVGLIVPHMLRRAVGHDHLRLIPACLLGGGVFLALCDLVARTAIAPAELPVGIVTALLGGPFFLWLLLVRRR